MVTVLARVDTTARTIAFVGRESVGKSQLISSISGQSAGEMNFRGSTVTVDRYVWRDIELIDTPGIHRQSDAETTRLALQALAAHEQVILVAQATHLDEDLAEMLPLVVGKAGFVVVSFWDKVQPGEASMEAIERLSTATGVEFVPVNGRSLTPTQRERLAMEMSRETSEASVFQKSSLSVRAGWRIEPRPTWMEHRIAGPCLAIVLLLVPALSTIFLANTFAGWLHPIVASWIEPALVWVDGTLPRWGACLLNAKFDDFGYGLLNMGPFLFVWALPTVLLFSLILGIYKTTGLIERINAALHPWSKLVGLSGRDLVRVMIGFGCNVPAVISTRACSSCSRSTAISAIAFGSACSYQLPATLAVLASASQQFSLNPWILPLCFLGYLLATTVIYLRLTSPRESRSSLNLLIQPSRPFLQWPTVIGVWREAWSTLRQFLFTAVPIFALICLVASTAAELGVLQAVSKLVEPAMGMMNLPAQAAFPTIMASVRKDGIFMFAGSDGLAMPLNAVQTLTAVYLAGVLLPCIVTALTIASEVNWGKTSFMLARQAVFAIAFSMILAWSGWWLTSFTR